MSDRLDHLLRRLPDEKMPAGLPGRIAQLVEARRQNLLASRRARRAATAGLFLCGMIGSSLVLADAQALTATAGPLLAALQNDLLDRLFASLVFGAERGSLLGSAELAPSLSAAPVIGLTLLTVAAFGGLARLLAASPLERSA